MRTRHIVIAVAVPAVLNLALYVLTLAPTVTFEDSGELGVAAYSLGIAHSPGYPVFCMIGRLFTLIPLGAVAWRLNLMSACFAAAASGIFSWATLIFLDRVTRLRPGVERGDPLIAVLAASVASGIMLGTALEVWEQAIITEVYAMTLCVAAIDLLLLFYWETAAAADRGRFFRGLCFTLALGLLVHPISIVLVPVALIYMLLTDRRYLTKARPLFEGGICFALGLLPIVYLPLASRRNPAADWGDPETFRNLYRLITGGLNVHQTYALSKTAGQARYYLSLVSQQWFPLLLVPVILGFVMLFRYSRKHFWIVATFLVLSAPLVTVATNINVTTEAPETVDANRWMVSVVYVFSYVALCLAAGVGFFCAATALARVIRSMRAAAIAVALMPAVFIPLTYTRVDMSNYVFAEDYARDVFSVTEENALIITGFDPESFPLSYYQAVEHRRPDLIIVSRLQQRSWYVHVLRDRYPALMAASASEAQEFLSAVAPLEAKMPCDTAYIQRAHTALLNSLVARTLEAGCQAYLTPFPADQIATNYRKESLGVVLRVTKPGEPMTALDLRQLRLAKEETLSRTTDFPARYMRNYYASLLNTRAYQLVAAGRAGEAEPFYQLATKLRVR
ncbi:MAG: DUF2723 domain-containing protein [bacterium]